MTAPSARARHHSPLYETLHNPSFLKIWMAGISAGTMRWLEVLAVGVYTLAETGSAFLVALMFFARTSPTPLCGPIAGALAERVPRRTLLLCGVGAMFCTSSTLAYLAFTGKLALWQVAVGAVVGGIVWSLEHTVRRTIVRDVVAPQNVGNAISLDTGTQNATRMMGPLVGGTLMAVVGLKGAFALGVVFYAFTFIVLLRLRVQLPAAGNERLSVIRSVIEGLRYVATNRTVAAVLAVTVVLNLFGFPYTSMVPVIGRDELGLSPTGIGVLMSAEGAGAVLGALTLAARVRPRQYRRIFIAGALGFLSAMAAFSAAPAFGYAAVALFAAGIGLGGFAAMQSTILLTVARPAMRSRVMGLLVLTIGAGPFGVLALGALAERLGASVALGWTSGTGIALMLVAVVLWPELLRPHE